MASLIILVHPSSKVFHGIRPFEKKVGPRLFEWLKASIESPRSVDFLTTTLVSFLLFFSRVNCVPSFFFFFLNFVPSSLPPSFPGIDTNLR